MKPSNRVDFLLPTPAGEIDWPTRLWLSTTVAKTREEAIYFGAEWKCFMSLSSPKCIVQPMIKTKHCKQAKYHKMQTHRDYFQCMVLILETGSI